ncbi:MAG: IclR family transcriptional regulator [Anaerolineales bacterium]|jgi:DNA-binding IclR family transcriptional regulator
MKQTTAPIQTVHKVARLLRCFTENEGELGVMQLSRMLDMHKSTVSRLLASLHSEGLVDKNQLTGKYQLGLNLVHMAGIVLDRLDLRQVAQPNLGKLAKQTQETINISILDRDMCLNVESIVSPKPIQYAGKLGRKYPLHCTATGRVLLADLPPEEREALLPEPLPAYTNKTITQLHTLDQILAQVRDQGYAIVHEEFQEGLSAIAAPIRDHTGKVVAAVSISGPTYRAGPDQIDQFIGILQETAKEISTNLGEGMLR